jgi:hypothetical protein
MVFRTRADALEAPISASDAVKDAVETMVRQFADPMAFYRELVQNSIDAGSTAIDVRLRYDSDDESLSVSVHDDGCGMNLETIERCLLVLFRSSKDKDPTKIGKFGVGFFSVFAVSPKVVRVDTGTGPDGFRVELRPDFTWEVTESSPRKGSTVSLQIPMRLNEARSFVERSLSALDRWCPHVEIALHVLSSVRGGEVDKRIDRPFGIEGPVTQHSRGPAGTVAITVATDGRAAFYKRGILLYECPNTFLPGTSFKVESNKLVHTVSRDNVKRDAAFDTTIQTVRRACVELLVPAAVQWARESLEAALSADSVTVTGNERNERAAKATRSVADLATEFEATVPVPLCDPDPSSKSRVSNGDPTRVKFYARKPGLLTAALAASARPVLFTHALGEAHAPFLRGRIDPYAVDPHTRYVAIAPRELSDTETDLAHKVEALLAAASIPLARVCQFDGHAAESLFLALDESALRAASSKGIVLDAGDAHTKLYALFSNRACAINGNHPTWRATVIAADNDAALAALIIARMIVLAAAKLDSARDRAIFEAFPSVD